jgi:uncharacterized ferritin-like protein (DUF455 family)
MGGVGQRAGEGAQARASEGASPPMETVERWAFDYVTCSSLAHKLAPPPLPRGWESSPVARRIERPGRPPELAVSTETVRARRKGLRGPKARARLFATFLHHELQAAELMCWALLAFPETPREFREGLARIALDEVRHMGLYAEHIARLGYRVGEFAVRDWFWERVPSVSTAQSFVAVMGMGFEGANLDHAATFAARFREAGDEVGAEIEERVGREEIAHVRFALKWFELWTGGQDFDTWAASLPEPLTPLVMRGTEVRVDARKKAGMSEALIEKIAGFVPVRPL